MFPRNVQDILQRLRHTIQDSTPNAKEAISYQILTFKLNGNSVHFAESKNHIGFILLHLVLADLEKNCLIM